ncbi:cytochrome P450 [Saccharomonospora sp. NPDC046836]|uniref:cytochrome P450 n=1 Tax=Saccharomonospora sp. NPDC046836 TaxID=3156921 RepID=UPI0033F0455A
MKHAGLHLALRPLHFLDAHAHLPGRYVELTREPAPKLLVWHPEVIEWLFRSDTDLRHPGSRSLIPLLGKTSMLWGDGSQHAAYRRVLGPALRGRAVLGYRAVIADTVDAAIDRLTPGTVLPLTAWTRELALRIIARIMLGPQGTTVLGPFAAWIDHALGSRSRTLAYRFLRGGLPSSGDRLEAMLVRTARDAAATHPHTLVGLLLAYGGPLARISDAELRDQLVSLLFAGHETTASATAWTLYWLDRNPGIRRDVADELAATSDDGSDATRVPLLQAVVQEALRLTPPVPAAGNRVLVEDAELFGRRVRAGTTLSPSVYLAHRQPDYFSRPMRFDPHRFLSTRAQASRYLPFGGGTRYCLGSQLSQVEVRMIVAALLRRRDLHSVNPRRGVPQLRGHTMAPADRWRVEVTACRG